MNTAALFRSWMKNANVKSPRHDPSDQEIFSINFIRNEFLSVRTRRLIVYAAFAYLAFNMIWAAGLLGQTLISSVKALFLEKELGKISSSTTLQKTDRLEMETLYERAVQDLTQVKGLTHLMKRRFFASRKLDALSSTLPARTWITEISGGREERMLMIRAVYLIDPQKPYELPTKAWIQALKADPHFSSDLKHLELGNSSQKTQGSADLFSFELTAEWPEEKH